MSKCKARRTTIGQAVAKPTLNKPLAYMEAYITEETNTSLEKESFIAAAHAMLVKHLGAEVSPGYVVVHEVAAHNWGFDGRTQAAHKRS